MRVVKTLPPLTKPSSGVNFKSRASFIHHGFKSLNKNVMYKSEATSAGYKKTVFGSVLWFWCSALYDIPSVTNKSLAFKLVES